MNRRRRLGILAAIGLAALAAPAWRVASPYVRPVRLVEVEPGGLYRGAWQQPWPMRRIVEDRGIRTVVALAHPVAHPIPARERDLVRGLGVRWKHIPIIDDPGQAGGKSVVDALDEAADWLADPENRPLYFHCHHGINRTSMVQMAWRIKHCGWTLDRAAGEIERTVGKDAVPKGDDYLRVARFVEEKVRGGARMASAERVAR